MSGEGPRIYLDTSAYLALLLGEPDAVRVERATVGAALLSSVLLVIEARRTIVRLARTGALTTPESHACLERLANEQAFFTFRDLTLDLCDSPVMPAIATPRSLDLAHLRAALWFHAERPLTRFLTLDQSQAAAARELGLPVR